MKRRDFLAATAAFAPLPIAAQRFQPGQDITPMIDALVAGKAVERGGVHVELPAIAENGNSVPMRIRVPSPMTEADHVSAIHVLAERNPRPRVAAFHLGPAAGRAEIDTRVRLAGTQKVTVIALLSGNRARLVQVDVLVTSAACLDEATLAT
jgi:sulfur-oxidizing protein SoxY